MPAGNTSPEKATSAIEITDWGLCDAGLWLVDPNKECPVCGAQIGEFCGKAETQAMDEK